MRPFKRRTGDRPVPGADQALDVAAQAGADEKPPVPGPVSPGEAAPPRARPAPAPGQIHPQHGARLLSADFYEDGAVLVHDHLRRKTTTFEAPEVDPGIDWDEWLKGLPR